MAHNSIRQREYRTIERMISFRLPPYFFQVGIATFLLAFVLLILLKLMDGDYEVWRQVARSSLLLGMLFSSLAGDAVEDERTQSLRAKSYSWAFVVGVAYAFVQPVINYGIDILLKPQEAVYKDAEVLPVLFFMLFIQIMSYRLLKKTTQC